MTDVQSCPVQQFRKWLSSRLIVERALEPTDELYEPWYDGMPGDPIDLLYQDIDLSEAESLNFLSGFRGTGKTTELFRLRARLTTEGYYVAYANALDFLLPSEPVEITDLLLVLAGAFSEAIERDFGIDPMKEGFWARLVHFLTKTHVTLDGFDVQAGIPNTETSLNFKTSLKQIPSFRQQLREKLAPRLGELRTEVHKFFEFARKRIRAAKPDRSVVFLFDQFEQLHDTLDTQGRVAESIAMLMANHRLDLQIPLMHMVFTVPPWLKFKLPDMRKIRLLYNVKLWNNNDKRTRSQPGWKVMRGIVQRRLTPDGMTRFFGKPGRSGSHKLADKLIEASGGHLRDLILLLRETLLRTTSLPTQPADVAAAIESLRSSYLPIPLADAKWLNEIAVKRDCLLKDRSAISVQRMTFFLDTHCALILRNGEEWYDVHPLIRDDVGEILRRDQQEKKS